MLNPQINNATGNYIGVLMTMQEELMQVSPRHYVLESCRRFLTQTALPDTRPDPAPPPMRSNVIHPNVKHWGKPRGDNYVHL